MSEVVSIEEAILEEPTQVPASAKEEGRRVRVYSVNTREILTTFFNEGWPYKIKDKDKKEGVIFLPKILPLPDGFKVLGAQLNWHTNSLDVMVEHESFELVPDGAMPPPATDMRLHMVAHTITPYIP